MTQLSRGGASPRLLHSFVLLSLDGTRLLLLFLPSLFSNLMGTALSFFRASSGAQIGTTRELGGADNAITGGQSQTEASVIDKSAVSQTGAEATQAAVQQSKEELPKCFVEGDLANWVKWVPPPRIKESRLTPEQRVKFHGHVDLIFHNDTLLGKRIGFDPNDVAEVMDEVREYLESEPMLIEDLPFDITVVADLHGQLYDLHRVFFENEKDGKPGWENMKYLFLGNYVDRGRQSIEIVMALFCLKMLYPDRIFLLRGNHEFMRVNRYGPRPFIDEIGDRYKIETAADLYIIVNSTFCYLSVAAIIGNVYFCAHAGISPSGFSRHQMRGLTKPFIHSTDDVLVHDIVCSDPAIGITGFTFNKERQTSIFYGYHALCHALHCMKVKVVIRGHTKLLAGYEVFYNTLYSLFTATAVDVPNDGAFAVINAEGKISLRILKVDPERVAWEKLLRKDQQPDDKTILDGCDGNKTGMLTRI